MKPLLCLTRLPILRLVGFSALSATALHCSSVSGPGGEPIVDAGSRADATALSDAAPMGDSDSDRTPDAADDSTSDSAAAPCSVHTSGVDSAIVDPTFLPFKWSPPASDWIVPRRRLAVAPGGDAYVAVAVTGPGAKPNDSLYVVVIHVQASGTIDPAFGTGGVVTLASWTALYDLIVDHNGNIVVTGTTPSSNALAGGFGLVVLRPDGSTNVVVDPINVGNPQPCAGCIADGADGYLTLSFTAMFNVAPTGIVSKTDALPASFPFNRCKMAQSTSAVSLFCGGAGNTAGETARYDRHGVLDPSFGTGGVGVVLGKDPMFYPWSAADGSLVLTEDGMNNYCHVLNNGTYDPKFADAATEPYSTTTFPVVFGAPRCDGTELFVENGPGGTLVLESVGASGPLVTSAGSVPAPDGGAGWYVDYGIDAHGAVLTLSEDELSLELVRFLPSK